ncbi:MAG: 4Fe-4S binding protein [Actinobacteria bacterium]|nr:4Fe-4S binding protein [Actinomycetota bacterium]
MPSVTTDLLRARTSRVRTSIVIERNCSGCGTCIAICPSMAIRPAPGGKPAVLSHRCYGCLDCVEVCPTGAIHEIGTEQLTNSALMKAKKNESAG